MAQISTHHDKASVVFYDGPLPESLIVELLSSAERSVTVGAQALFLGRVRADLHGGQRVSLLEYECYEEMALPVIDRILSETVEKHNLNALRVRHSLGAVGVGQLCFAVMAAAPRRAAAFGGCGSAVDRIKKEVPIFAKEIFEDGGHIWKRNR